MSFEETKKVPQLRFTSAEPFWRSMQPIVKDFCIEFHHFIRPDRPGRYGDRIIDWPLQTGVFIIGPERVFSQRASMTDSTDTTPHYRAGIELFNNCEFFEAHDVWEELWAEYRGPSRTFYQGLIQVAVALHHFCNGNVRGAKKLYHSSRAYLDPYRPMHLGCDLDHLFLEMEECFGEMLAQEEGASAVEVNPELIPEIHLDEEAFSKAIAEGSEEAVE